MSLPVDLDFDALLAEEAETRCGQKLRVQLILDAIDKETAAKVERALRDTSVPARHIAKALGKIGHPVSKSAIDNWRERYAR